MSLQDILGVREWQPGTRQFGAVRLTIWPQVCVLPAGVFRREDRLAAVIDRLDAFDHPAVVGLFRVVAFSLTVQRAVSVPPMNTVLMNRIRS